MSAMPDKSNSGSNVHRAGLPHGLEGERKELHGLAGLTDNKRKELHGLAGLKDNELKELRTNVTAGASSGDQGARRLWLRRVNGERRRRHLPRPRTAHSRTGGSIIGPSAVGRGIKWWLISHHFKTSTSDVLQLCGACYGDVDTGHKALMPGVNADSLVPGVTWLSLRGTFSFVWSGMRAFCPRGTLRRSVEASKHPHAWINETRFPHSQQRSYGFGARLPRDGRAIAAIRQFLHHRA
jgi:hypothetical protein